MDNQLKTALTTSWETYAYPNIPFVLINAGATFQRAMGIDFRGLINNAVVVYLDDIIVFSKTVLTISLILRKLFERCTRYGILLNPKKTSFAVTQGILLGYVVSKDGIMIDP